MHTVIMKTIQIRNVPDSLKQQFKVACVTDGVSMNTKTLQLIKRYLAERGQRKSAIKNITGKPDVEGKRSLAGLGPKR